MQIGLLNIEGEKPMSHHIAIRDVEESLSCDSVTIDVEENVN